jgi:hypothetical protein
MRKDGESWASVRMAALRPPSRWPSIKRSGTAGFARLATYPQGCWKPLSIWRAIACWARALLNGVAMLVRKQPIAPADWAVLTGDGELARQLPTEMNRLEQWQFVAVTLNAWLEIISFRPGLGITPDEKAQFVLSI